MQRIEYEMRERHIDQTKLSEMTGINRSSINRIVNEKECVYPSWKLRIAEALKWERDPAELFEQIEVI